MAPNSLSPAFVRINYSSIYGPHSMTVPSVPIIDGGLDSDSGGYQFDLRGGAIPVAIDGAIRDFVTLMANFHATTTDFIDYVAYTQADPTSVAVPIWSRALGIDGAADDALWAKAVQNTWTFRADDFTLFKLVGLDVMAQTFNRVTDRLASASLDDLVEYVTDDVTWLASRGGGRPVTFLQQATTLNEKLRRAYGMT